MLSRVEFTVLGLPAPQGSKTFVPTAAGGRSKESNEAKLKPWRAAVTAAAHEAMDGRQLRTGPLELRVTFVFPRLATHFGTGRNAGRLKPSAPLYVRVRPDVDKLMRAIGDALTGVVFRDDGQIVIAHLEKHYGDPPCAHVVVDELDLEDDRPAPEDAA